MSGERFSILFVCTANLCRSQLAEVQLRDRLAEGVDVRSAGTKAIEGEQIPARFRPLFDSRDAEVLTASRLTPATLSGADLVLTMTRTQRAEVVQLLPRSVRYTYPVKDFVTAAEVVIGDAAIRQQAESHADSWQLLLEAVQSRRGITRRNAGSVDIEDSARANPRELRKVKAEVSEYVDRLAAVVQTWPRASLPVEGQYRLPRQIAHAL